MTPARRRQLLQARTPQLAIEHHEAHKAAALEELAAAPIDGTTAEKLAEILRDPPAEPRAQAVPFIEPEPGRSPSSKRRKARRKASQAAPRKAGRPALGEAGSAARVSVSLAPSTLAAVAAYARRRKLRVGTALREIAEAWAER